MPTSLPIYWLIICAVATATSVAQQPGVELQLGARALELGEAVNAQLVCTNTGSPETPRAAVPDGLTLELSNPTPMSSSMTRIVNGRRSDRATYTYSFRLTARKVGTFTLGPITVEAGGTTYQTDPVRIVVRDTQVASTPRGDRYIFAELTVTPTSLYVTESYEATLTFGIRKVEIGGRVYNLNMLQDVLDARASQLSVFMQGQARRSERWMTDEEGRRHQYEVFTVPVQIRAEQAGQITVGPVFLKTRYPTRLQRGFFGGYQVSDYRRENARADAVTVTVKTPPEEGRPADYTGAIGRFRFRVDANPDRVEQGQPITLSASISGSPLDGVSGPDLSAHPELASRFDYTHDELVGDIEGGAKVFRRAIFPKQIGEQAIPPITWSYFDTRQARYVTLSSDSIPISVDPPSETSTNIVALQNPAPEASETGLTLLTGGLSPNFIDASATLADQSFRLTSGWIAAFLVSPLAWMTVALTSRRRAQRRADPHGARRRRARRLALARISHALKGSDPARSLQHLADALTEYVADRFGLGAGTVTPDDVRTLLATNGFDETTALEVVAFLEQAVAAQYAPAPSGSSSPREIAASVRRWIARIEKQKT